MQNDYQKAIEDAKQRVTKLDKERETVDYQLRRAQAEVDRLLALRKKITDEASRLRYILNLPAAAPTPALEAIPV